MRKFLYELISFLIGSTVLVFFSFLEKKLSGHTISLISHIVIGLFGGNLGLIIGLSYLKIKENKNKIEHLNLVLRAIRNINKLIVKEKKTSRLLQGTCDILRGRAARGNSG